MKTPAALRREVLARVEPSAARTRAARRIAADLARRLKRLALARGVRVQPKLVGSLAKDTHLSEPLDIDVFVLFSPTVPRSKLERHGVALGKAVLKKHELRYAEHPYVHGTLGGFEIDVVPAYKLKDAAGKISAVDRTPFHTEYVRRRAGPRHRREIRLLKRWLRGVGCYGAETSIGGVSGYLAELLVLRYRAFDRAIEAVSAWRAPVELSLHGRPDPLGGPLVFIDPVDASRNAAAAVQPATFDRLVRAARAYRKKPRLEFFFPRAARPADPARLRELLAKRPTLGLELGAPRGRPETVLPQSQRLATKVARALERHGFTTAQRDAADVGGGRVLLLLGHDPALLPSLHEHVGPPAADPANSERFLAKWRGRSDTEGEPRKSKGRWVVLARRAQRTPRELLDLELPRLLEGFDLPSSPPPRLLDGADLPADPARHLALTRFLTGLDPWDA